VLELEHSLTFDAERTEDFFRQLPTRAAVCLIEPRDAAAAPLLVRTQDLRRRLQRLLGPDDPTSKRLNLREFARGVQYRVTSSAFEQTLTYYHNAKRVHPGRYRDLLRIRPPAVLKDLPEACWIFSKCGAARSRFGATRRFPDACIRK
jgi:hypothetical protein